MSNKKGFTLIRTLLRRNLVNVHGFTLIELLVAISIVAVLSTVGVTTYQGVQSKARDSIRKNDLTKIATALELYYQKNGKYVLGEGSCSTDTYKLYNYNTDNPNPESVEIANLMSDGQIPKDPKTEEGYCYISSENGQFFSLLAKLDNCSEADNCYPSYTKYNHGVASDNTTVAYADANQVTTTAAVIGSPTIPISGKVVRNGTTQGIPGVLITVSNKTLTYQTSTVITDQNGNFSVNDAIRPGDQYLVSPPNDNPSGYTNPHPTNESALCNSNDTAYNYQNDDDYRIFCTDVSGRISCGTSCDFSYTPASAVAQATTPTLAIGWSLIGLTVDKGSNYYAADFLQDLNDNFTPVAGFSKSGSNISFIVRWDPLRGRYSIYDGPSNNYSISPFTIVPGEGYYIKSDAPGSATISGTTPALSSISIRTGYKLISFPKALTGITTAEQLLQAMLQQGLDVRLVIQWYGGRFIPHEIGSQANPFSIEPGRGYFIRSYSTDTKTFTLP